MILEALVTTTRVDGSVHVAPMGPRMNGDWDRFELRPFTTSETYTNLTRHPQGVLHVTDDVELLARAAVGRLNRPPPVQPAPVIDGYVLENACRWYAFEVLERDGGAARATLQCVVRASGRARDFFGFNRAKHAVIELAIVASRVHLLDAPAIDQALDWYRPWVEKTGGAGERRAWECLEQFLREQRPPRD